MSRLWRTSLLALIAAPASAQQVTNDGFLQVPVAMGDGWAGFADWSFMLDSALTLVLAAALAAVLAYHPKHRQTVDTLEEIEAPRVYILYSVIGALIGILVVGYGLVVGFVLFGIGGLIRFRTILRSPSMTGHIIFVTMIGLSCGLDLPNVAVLATLFDYVLIHVLENKITYRVDVRALPAEQFTEATAEYRRVIEGEGCRILSEKKNADKGRVRFIFRSVHKGPRSELQDAIEAKVEPALKGSVDWELD